MRKIIMSVAVDPEMYTWLHEQENMSGWIRAALDSYREIQFGLYQGDVE